MVVAAVPCESAGLVPSLSESQGLSLLWRKACSALGEVGSRGLLTLLRRERSGRQKEPRDGKLRRWEGGCCSTGWREDFQLSGGNALKSCHLLPKPCSWKLTGCLSKVPGPH